jgi:uncharacterized protein with HEPN domain
MRRDDDLFLGDILAAIGRIESYVSGVDEATFFESHILQDAVIRQLEIVGEAAKRLSPSFRDSRSAIPWRDIIGMRAKLAHDYMTVDLQAVWDTAVHDIPALRASLTR